MGHINLMGGWLHGTHPIISHLGFNVRNTLKFGQSVLYFLRIPGEKRQQKKNKQSVNGLCVS